MLIPAKVIPVQDWMRGPEIAAVFDALQDPEAAPQTLIVGGAVRNILMGRPPGDCDLATIHTPDQVMTRLTRAGIKVVPTGIDHGTVTAVLNEKVFEITTLRRDVKTDGRHAVVAFTTDWVEDAQRRDFTINTLLMNLSGEIFDPIRSGIKDIEDKKIIFVGEPQARITEDTLRILRFFRFYALYGEGYPDPAALNACRETAVRIPTLSRERITHEFIRILCAPKPEDVLTIMFDNNVMADIAHKDADFTILRMLCGLQSRLNIDDGRFESRLSILAAGQESHLSVFEKYLSFSRRQEKILRLCLKSFSGRIDFRECLYRNGRETGTQMVAVNAAANQETLSPSMISRIENWVQPTFPLTGEDIGAMGVGQGPGIGRVLSSVESWWISEDFKPDRARCLQRAREAAAEQL